MRMKMRVDWIHDAIQECLTGGFGGEDNDFSYRSDPARVYNGAYIRLTEYDESDDIEGVKTITSYGED